MPNGGEAMSYAGARVCCDADSHIMETFDWLKSFADPEIRDALPAMKLGGAGKMAEKAIAKAIQARADAAKTAELRANIIGSAKGWAAFGAFDKHDRSRALDDPILAREEIVNAAKFGCKAVWLSAAPAAEKSPGHADLDIVWKSLIGEGLPFMLHVGGATRVLPKAFENNGMPRPTDWLGGGENLRVKDYMVLSFAPQMFLSALVFDGVFERFPELRGGVIELGGGWVPQFLRALDAGQRMFKKSDPQVGTLPLKASDYVRRQVKFTPFPGEDIGHMIRDAGAELFLFSSDYPHPEGGKDPIRKFEETMEGISDEAKDQFYRRNFEEMMGIAA
jgi:predicted TIM-barrel fold metal-dependent hydrolase